MKRREFLQLARDGSIAVTVSALPLGASVSNVKKPPLVPGRDNRDMLNERLLLLGLNGLARSHAMDYFTDGHRAAAMVAAHLLCLDNKLDQQVTARITELVELNWAFSKLCESFPDADPEPSLVDRIGVALTEGGETLRQVGHNAIFAMLAIKAFRRVPSAATPQRIDGVYWVKRGDHSVGIGHLFKYPYSYYDLLRRARDPLLERAWEQKAYHLF